MKKLIPVSILLALFSLIAVNTDAVVNALIDDFQRADESPVTAPWTQRTDNNEKVYLDNNALRAKDTGTTGFIIYTGTTFTNDQSTEVHVIYATNGCHICVRANISLTAGYDLLVSSTGTTTLYDMTNWSVITTYSFTPAIGDTYRLEAVGTSINSYRNNILLGTVTNSSTSSGAPAVGCQENVRRIDRVTMTGMVAASNPTGRSFGFGN